MFLIVLEEIFWEVTLAVYDCTGSIYCEVKLVVVDCTGSILCEVKMHVFDFTGGFHRSVYGGWLLPCVGQQGSTHECPVSQMTFILSTGDLLVSISP